MSDENPRRPAARAVGRDARRASGSTAGTTSYIGESNGHWGQLGTDPQREAWDSYGRIPEPGVNLPLDSFLARKHLDHAALVRLGARLSSPNVLAFALPGGIKFRDVVTDRRWAFVGSEYDLHLALQAGSEAANVHQMYTRWTPDGHCFGSISGIAPF